MVVPEPDNRLCVLYYLRVLVVIGIGASINRYVLSGGRKDPMSVLLYKKKMASRKKFQFFNNWFYFLIGYTLSLQIYKLHMERRIWDTMENFHVTFEVLTYNEFPV